MVDVLRGMPLFAHVRDDIWQEFEAGAELRRYPGGSQLTPCRDSDALYVILSGQLEEQDHTEESSRTICYGPGDFAARPDAADHGVRDHLQATEDTELVVLST